MNWIEEAPESCWQSCKRKHNPPSPLFLRSSENPVKEHILHSIWHILSLYLPVPTYFSCSYILLNLEHTTLSSPCTVNFDPFAHTVEPPQSIIVCTCMNALSDHTKCIDNWMCCHCSSCRLPLSGLVHTGLHTKCKMGPGVVHPGNFDCIWHSLLWQVLYLSCVCMVVRVLNVRIPAFVYSPQHSVSPVLTSTGECVVQQKWRKY